MTDKNSMTTIRWIIGVALLIIAFGVYVAMLISGMGPSCYLNFLFVASFFIVCMAILVNKMKKKANRIIAQKKAHASEKVAKGDFAGAISIWKEILPEVGEKHVNDLLPEIERAYHETGSDEGKRTLSELKKLYADFFDMSRRIKQLDAKGRIMRESLAGKICETVNKLPES